MGPNARRMHRWQRVLLSSQQCSWAVCIMGPSTLHACLRLCCQRCQHAVRLTRRPAAVPGTAEQSAARVQVTALGKGAAGAAAGGDWDDKPATEPWSEQEQHKKVRRAGGCWVLLGSGRGRGGQGPACSQHSRQPSTGPLGLAAATAAHLSASTPAPASLLPVGAGQGAARRRVAGHQGQTGGGLARVAQARRLAKAMPKPCKVKVSTVMKVGRCTAPLRPCLPIPCWRRCRCGTTRPTSRGC